MLLQTECHPIVYQCISFLDSSATNKVVFYGFRKLRFICIVLSRLQCVTRSTLLPSFLVTYLRPGSLI